VGVSNPQSWGRGRRMGSEMVPFERALESSYRPSIVTFPLSLRVSEILPLLFSRTPLFPNPPLVSQKFPHVPLGIGGSVADPAMGGPGGRPPPTDQSLGLVMAARLRHGGKFSPKSLTFGHFRPPGTISSGRAYILPQMFFCFATDAPSSLDRSP